MRVADLAGAIPALLLVGLLPGLALTHLISTRWSTALRWAAAPGLSCGVVGILGLAFHDLHVAFEAASVLPCVGVLAVAAAVRRRVWRVRPRSLTPSTAAMVAAALVSGAISVAVLTNAFRTQMLPVEADAPVHASVAERIATEHDVLPVIAEPVDATGSARPRPAYEAEVALISELGGPDPAHGLLPVALLSVLLLPLGLTVLALETTGSRLLATVSPLLAVGMLFPLFPAVFGEFPLIVDSTLVVPLVLAVRGCLFSRPHRDGVAPVLACVAAIWVIHGTEVVTAALVGAPLLAAMAWRMRDDWRSVAAGTGTAMLAAGAAAVGVTLMTHLPAVPPAQPPPGAGVAITSSAGAFAGTIARGSVQDVVLLMHGFVLPAQGAVVLYVLGIVALLWTRRQRWLLVAHVLMLVCLVDVEVTGAFSRLWKDVYPWSTVDRLLSIQFFVLPLILAEGVAWAARGVIGLPRASRTSRLMAAAVIGGGATLVVLVSGTTLINRQYHDEVQARTVIDTGDLAVIQRMAATLPPGALVATDGADAGQWIDILTPDRLYFSKGYIQLYNHDQRLVLLDNACTSGSQSPEPAEFASVDAVFVGAHQAPDAVHHWSATCLARLSWLRPIAEVQGQDGASAAFLVQH